MKTPQVVTGIHVREGLIHPVVLSRDKAEHLARINNATDENGWTYVAIPIPESKRNLYHVQVSDEKGNIIECL
jgi:predicted amidohydrolase